jgi:branched-chain amino acid transport system permease protein
MSVSTDITGPVAAEVAVPRDRRSGKSGRPRFLRFLIFAVIAQAVPTIVSDSTLLTINLACVYAVAAVGLNVILGLGGLISIGQAGVMAVGGYTTILLFGKSVGLGVALLLACVGGALISALMGFVGARVKTHYFVLASLAIAEIIVLVATNATGLTGGSNGTALAGVPIVAGLNLTTARGFFHFGSIIVLIVVYLADALRVSRGGLGLSALTMNEYVAVSAGVDPRVSRALATSVGGVFGGLAGGMLALLDGYLGPASFDLGTATLLLLIVIVAGRAANGSVVIAALILTFLSQGFLTDPTVGQLAYGVGLIALIIVAPDGLFGAATWSRRLASRSWGRIGDRMRARP